MDENSSMSMMMPTYFDFTTNLKNFIFKNWNATNTKNFVGTLLAVFAVALLLEFTKDMLVLVNRIRRQYESDPITPRRRDDDLASSSATIGSSTQEHDLLRSLHIPASIGLIRRKKIGLYCLECLMYMLDISCGYLLMLAVMTYNGYVFITVIVGTTLGFFLLSRFRQRTFGSQAANNYSVQCSESEETQSLHSEQSNLDT